MRPLLVFTPERRDDVLAQMTEMLLELMPAEKPDVFQKTPRELIQKLRHCWDLAARPDQRPPGSKWLIWLLLGGRGSGKTRAGAEWVRERVRRGARRIALIAPTFNEAREVMIEGVSGLLNIGRPEERPVYVSSRKRLVWPGGATGQVFSSEDPEGLRGSQFDTAWADEFCAWAYPEKTLSNLRFGLRLESAAGPPQLTVTTTPKPRKSLQNLLRARGLKLHRMKTADNAANLSEGFVEDMNAQYGGTRLGRQELDGEILTDHAGALWTRAMIESACGGEAVKDYARVDYGQVVIAIDPPASSGERANACGIIVAARALGSGHSADTAVILHDGTLQGRSPEGWARQAAKLFERYDADYLVAEANQGGEMVRSVLRQAGAHMSVRLVHAAKSKTDRASPVALAYEQGRVRHAGRFPDLEDELCRMGAEEGGSSPDRADALVWAVTELLLRKRVRPRVWVLGG